MKIFKLGRITYCFILMTITASSSLAQESNTIWSNYAKLLDQAAEVLSFSGRYGTFDHTAVNYGIIHDDPKAIALLDRQSQTLAIVSPPTIKNEKLAFWINAYNFFTLLEVRDHYGTITSLKEIGWKNEKFVINGKKHSLDQIEHEILRPMKEPRIHFAINCASVSCPALSATPYLANSIYQQLDAAVANALKNPMHLRKGKKWLGMGSVEFKTTKILNWFGDDFDVDPYQGVFGFIRRFAPKDMDKLDGYSSDLEYDWRLNSNKNILEAMRTISKDEPEFAARLFASQSDNQRSDGSSTRKK